MDNTAPDARWLLPMIQAVGDIMGGPPELGLADACYRSEHNLGNAPIELVVALGREGMEHAEVDAEQYPHTGAMAAKSGPPQAGRDKATGSPLCSATTPYSFTGPSVPGSACVAASRACAWRVRST